MPLEDTRRFYRFLEVLFKCTTIANEMKTCFAVPFRVLWVVLVVVELAATLAVASSLVCPCNTTETWTALRSLYNSTNGPNWHRQDNWLVRVTGTA